MIRRKVRKEDFEIAVRALNDVAEFGTLPVCEGYQREGNEIVAKYDYSDKERWRLYEPLKEVPDLFLRFAWLHESADIEESILAFVHKYGLPDGRRENLEGSTETIPDRLSLSRIRGEARRARAVLALYEAASNTDVQEIKSVFAENRHDPAFARYHDILAYDYAEWESVPLPREVWFALEFAGNLTRRISEQYCRQFCIPSRQGASEFGPWCIRPIWRFDNLLGVAYLQAYRMMTSGDLLARCEFCNRPLSLTNTHPEGRKRRQDRRFCDEVCRQANHRSKKKARLREL